MVKSPGKFAIETYTILIPTQELPIKEQFPYMNKNFGPAQ